MSCEVMVEVFEVSDIWRHFEPSWVDQLTVRPVYPRLGNHTDVDWFEAEEYFTQGENSLIKRAVERLSSNRNKIENIVDGIRTFEYMLVGCTSTMDRDVGQAYTFTLMSFPILKAVLVSQSDVVKDKMKTTMTLNPAYVDTETGCVDYSGASVSYARDAIHFAPTLSIRPPMGNGISFTCGIYALPVGLKERLVESAELHHGLLNL